MTRSTVHQKLGRDTCGHPEWGGAQCRGNVNHLCRTVLLDLCFSSVQSLCCNTMECSTPGLPVHHQLLEFIQTHIHWVGDAIQPAHSLSSPSPPTIMVFSNESLLCIRWTKHWSVSFNISPSNEYSGLIYFRIDKFEFLAVQGTPKSLLQHHNSKASLLWRSAFFVVQNSYPYMTSGNSIASLHRPLSAKWWIWFLICCLDFS